MNMVKCTCGRDYGLYCSSLTMMHEVVRSLEYIWYVQYEGRQCDEKDITARQNSKRTNT